MMSMLRIVGALGALLLLAACGGSDDGASSGGSATGTPGPAETPPADLTISVWETPDSQPTVHRLTCHPLGGDHPDPAAACAYLDQAAATAYDPFAPVPGDAVCTEQYGGPATAEVSGTWGDRQVLATFDLVNGCEISRWDDAAALLGSPPAGPTNP